MTHHIDEALFVEMYRDKEVTLTDIANRFGMAADTVSRRASMMGLPLRGPIWRPAAVDPTPEEIAERAAEIRSRWSESERRKRIVGPKEARWTPPSFCYDGRDVTFSR